MSETLEGRYLALPCIAGRALDGGPVVPERVARELARRRVSATLGGCACGGRLHSVPMDPRPGCAPLLMLNHTAECEAASAALLRTENCHPRLIGFEVVRLPEGPYAPHWLDQPAEMPRGLVDHVCRIPDERVEWPAAVTLGSVMQR